ncbi:DUF6115 domain-containing protein [Paenibacillus protaetiae]|uniref:Uncharacterized protein n=1 Tax=Paenibacillus protaetiae TaxID=2509456 RepID=A0A4P6ERS9_9BACL|nr:hypothetical protein [Paenibacillus protaetiae]QAY65622.1 hypothetical protein ET464_03725 [Paenibacillus protaetiae]
MWQYIALLGAVIAIAALIMPRNKNETAVSAKPLQKMELAFEQFMENMELDIEEMSSLAAEAHRQTNERLDAQHRKIVELEQQLAELRLSSPAADCPPAASTTGSAPAWAEGTAQGAGVIAAAAEAAAAASVAVSAASGAGDTAPDVDEQPSPSAAETHADASASGTIQARYEQLIQLYKEGKSIEAIAKRLQMNKGEVQLILQLAKQEAAAHA